MKKPPQMPFKHHVQHLRATAPRTAHAAPPLVWPQAPSPAVQPKSHGGVVSGARTTPTFTPAPQAVQTKPAGGQQARIIQPPQPNVHQATSIQPAKKGKGGKGKGGSAAKKQSKAQRSFNNLAAYRSGWIKKNDITLETVTDFIKNCPYPNGIRGHASGDNSQGEQDNTRNDCQAYKTWHTGKYGWRG